MLSLSCIYMVIHYSTLKIEIRYYYRSAHQGICRSFNWLSTATFSSELTAWPGIIWNVSRSSYKMPQWTLKLRSSFSLDGKLFSPNYYQTIAVYSSWFTLDCKSTWKAWQWRMRKILHINAYQLIYLKQPTKPIQCETGEPGSNPSPGQLQGTMCAYRRCCPGRKQKTSFKRTDISASWPWE